MGGYGRRGVEDSLGKGFEGVKSLDRYNEQQSQPEAMVRAGELMCVGSGSSCLYSSDS